LEAEFLAGSAFFARPDTNFKIIMKIPSSQIKAFGQSPNNSHEVLSKTIADRIKKILTYELESSVDVYLQGSYINRTNINGESDVDIVVEHTDYWYPGDVWLNQDEKKEFWDNFKSSGYSSMKFREKVVSILEKSFPNKVDDSGDKCIRVNFGKMHADVVPALSHYRLQDPHTVAHEGIQFFTKSGKKIISFPKKHIKNGEDKNSNTEEKYKELVRIFKNLKAEMVDKNYIEKASINSFLIENFIWNVPPEKFTIDSDTYEVLRQLIIKVWSDMKHPDGVGKYKQIDDLFYLFGGSYSSDQVASFVKAVWNYVEYK